MPPDCRLNVQPGAANWSDDIRTPLCLIRETDSTFTLLYTAKRRGELFWSVGLVRLRLAVGMN